MEDSASCMLVIIGATPEGKKELLGFQVGERESDQSWRELLVDLKARGLSIAPEIAVGDGAMGFWKALEEIFPTTRHQRCWQHKLVNILNKVPKSVQSGIKEALREVRDAPDRATAETAISAFAEKYQAKYPKGRRMPDQGSRIIAGLLRLSGRTPFAACWLRPFHGSDQRPPGL